VTAGIALASAVRIGVFVFRGVLFGGLVLAAASVYAWASDSALFLRNVPGGSGSVSLLS